MLGLSLLRDIVPADTRSALHIASGKLSRALFPRPHPAAQELYLHLGCGSIDHPRFVNVDGYPLPHVHHVRSIADLSPFADGSAGLVYASHCLEHFPRAAVPRVLAEWRRVLRAGGVLRLSVPDFDRLLAIYERHGRDLGTIDQVLMGGQHNLFDFHHVAFTRRSLGALLEQAGLREVREWAPGSDELTSLPDWSSREIEIKGEMHAVSLNLEASR
jgi:predicted SAM-dependent methyltransferase